MPRTCLTNIFKSSTIWLTFWYLHEFLSLLSKKNQRGNNKLTVNIQTTFMRRVLLLFQWRALERKHVRHNFSCATWCLASRVAGRLINYLEGTRVEDELHGIRFILEQWYSIWFRKAEHSSSTSVWCTYERTLFFVGNIVMVWRLSRQIANFRGVNPSTDSNSKSPRPIKFLSRFFCDSKIQQF